jgi:hypothetical protein
MSSSVCGGAISSIRRAAPDHMIPPHVNQIDIRMGLACPPSWVALRVTPRLDFYVGKSIPAISITRGGAKMELRSGAS